jgi:hypothetical protein
MSVIINGEEYIKKSELVIQKVNDKQYVIVRCIGAGVHAGYLSKRTGGEVELLNSRRLWAWSGAMCLSDLAMSGPKNPSGCKFAVTLPHITLLNACEIIPTTETAREIIEKVAIWQK